MKNLLKILLKITVAIVMIVSITSCKKNDYNSNFKDTMYAHIFTKEDVEYANGRSPANFIEFKENSIHIYEIHYFTEEEKEEIKENLSYAKFMDFQTVDDTFKNPVYDSKTNTIKADKLKDEIKVIDDNKIEYKGKTYEKQEQVEESDLSK
ncbi:MAG: hypothetical protein Q4B36_05000 [Tissierellia bacterium]|nr:hypothetical protein [Tissierellia bacterium]